MTVSFVRQLGAESGVQLAPVQDRSELPSQSITDQVFGIAMRLARGRIDKAFKVDTGNARKKLGSTASVRESALNESLVHVLEALDNGAYEAVVSRLTTSDAKIKWAVCRLVPGAPASGQDPATDDTYSFTVEEDEPEDDFLFAVKHLECFNDGIKLALHADGNRYGGVDQAVSRATIRITDKTGQKLYEFTGSFDKDARDDYGEPAWLPDVASRMTDNVEVLSIASASIPPTSAAYGDNAAGNAKWVESPVLVCFEEGGTSYSTEDYIRARDQLQYTAHNYAYISSGGSRSPALLAQLAQLAFNTSRQLKFDIPGELPPEAAIAFAEQLNMQGQKEAHLLHAFWSPLKSLDPTGINGKGYFGVATLNIALACGRNAYKDANGFARKNFPIAGKDWPISRQAIVQTYTPSGPELSALAKAKINPCIFSEYDGGGRYVFFDSLTCAPVDNSLKKLIAVADMACHTDDFVTRMCRAELQKPMKTAVKTIRNNLQKYFEGAEAADWTVPSDDPAMGGASSRYVVAPRADRPYDAVDVRYFVRYDGTARAIYAEQTITR